MTLKHRAEESPALLWRKSSHSSNEGANCVEVATVAPGGVRVRDSKDVAGPQLAFTVASWSAFTGFAAQ
jgi:hypothetical protein